MRLARLWTLACVGLLGCGTAAVDLRMDTNGDGVADLPASEDNDFDGVSNAEEEALGTDPEVADSDGDGLTDGQELTFDLAREDDSDILIDRESGSKWIAFTGTAFEGPLEGQNLERVHSTASFWFAWTDFYPATELFLG